MSSRYENFIDSVRKAGFFTTSVEDMTNWDRIAVCSKRLPDSGYTGNSFWVSELGAEWYVGTWGGAVYRVHGEDALIAFGIEWLTLEPDTTASDVASELRKTYMLEPVNESEFRSLLGERGSP